MPHVIGFTFRQPPRVIDLTTEEYQSLKGVKRNLLAALSLEEKLALVLENYLDFELELQQLTTRHCLFSGKDWSASVAEIHTVNRRIVNLLSAGRLYIDQVKHDVSELFGPQSEQFEELKKAFSHEYDAHLGYRVLEAVRNQMQHRCLPIYNMTYSSLLDRREGCRLVINTCAPCMSLKHVEEQGNFKAQILQELKRLRGPGQDLVDLKPLVREYVASVARVQDGIRSRMNADVTAWDRDFREAIDRVRVAFGDGLLGLELAYTDERGEALEKTDIFDDLITRRVGLERRNRNATHLREQYVSTEVVGDREES